MTNRRCQERIKLRSRKDKPMRARKIASMMSSENQKNLRMISVKSEE
jgi:hypothetical protein